MGYLIVDPKAWEQVPHVRLRLLELCRRVDGVLQTLACHDLAGTLPLRTIYRVQASDLGDAQLAEAWEAVLSDFFKSPRQGAGQRRKRRR